MIDEQAFIDLVLQNKWFAVGAIVIGGVVRLLKTDMLGNWFSSLPAAWKRIIPLALGGLVGALESLASGRSLTEAIVKGLLLAGGGSILGHDGIVEAIRGGREFGEKPGQR